MRFYRKALRSKKKQQKLKYFEDAETRLLQIIEDFPDDELSLKLVSGQRIGRHDWLTLIESRIEHLRKQLKEKSETQTSREKQKEKWSSRQESFITDNAECLESLTTSCLISLYAAKPHTLDIKRRLRHALDRKYFVALQDFTKNKANKILSFIKGQRHLSGRFYQKLILLGKEDSAVDLLMKGGELGYMQRFEKQVQARRELYYLANTKHKIDKHKYEISYTYQRRLCSRPRPYQSEDLNLEPGHVYKKFSEIRQVIDRALCDVKPLRQHLNQYLSLYFSDELIAYKKEYPKVSYTQPLRYLIKKLYSFGHLNEAIRTAHMIPNGYYSQHVNRREADLIVLLRDLTEMELIKRISHK